ncbi:MAG TPA: hypothetical protein VFJ94_10680 [Intrasporangium sp.]|uniref:hypothetical protein n=1 Tax=Intrasporangium sp. TaxID=1925024 RepID=UPI002D78420C|nr:hypothetical protein [Intrasporangium sp.]HET7398975.1 hypothetical protein [Intrasporangium sp.]
MDKPCETRLTSDGQTVRVRGSIGQADLDVLAAQVRAYADSRCGVESDVPMLAIAQRIHGRKHYACGRERGHEPPHRWPDIGDGPAHVEWTEADQ